MSCEICQMDTPYTNIYKSEVLRGMKVIPMKKMLMLFCLLLVGLLAMQAGSATTVIVINETEEAVVSIESMYLSGDLQNNILSVTGSGEVLAGEQARVYLFGPSEDIVIKNLKVNKVPTTVSFDDYGYFFLADIGEFSFTGTMEIRTIGQLVLNARGPINELSFNLDHGYVIGGDKFGVYDEQIVIQRSEKVAMLVDGSFRFTYGLLQNEFTYAISFQSFGSSLGSYTLNLLNGETVSSVTGVLKWEQIGNQLILDFQGATADVLVNGFFDADTLRMPLPEDTHDVLLEADPEKKLLVSTTAKEIDVSESSLWPQFANARAFLARSSDVFTITVEDLELMPSLAASVSSARNTVAVTEKGSILGELTYDYANTGVDYLEIDVPGDPLYASTDYGAVKLTKDEKLMLAFPKSEYGDMSVMYFTTRGKMKPIDIIKVPLASTELPISEMTSYILLPAGYFIVETFGATGGTELPSFEGAVFFLLLVGFFGWLLLKSKKFILAYIIFALGLLMFHYGFFLLLLAATIFIKVRQFISRKSLKWILAGAGLLVVLVVVLWGFFALAGSIGGGAGVAMYEEEYLYKDRGVGDYDMAEEMPMAAPMMEAALVGEYEEAAITVPTRTGVLPVELKIPRLGKTVEVSNTLVTKEHPVKLCVLIIATWLKWLFILPAVLFAGGFCLRTYKAARQKIAASVPRPPR